jgi:putative ABC transport system ATP-binding protein
LTSTDTTRTPIDDAVVEVHDVHREYRIGGEVVRALAGISLQVRRGEYLSIMGPSGSGKTTLFNMIGGLDTPTRGWVKVLGQEISSLKSHLAARLRCRKIGYIFQTYNIIPVLTALDNVALPALLRGLSRAEARERAARSLERVGLGDRLTHRPDELSGGQQQRVAIARAFVNEPSIILADEPTGNLDLHTGEEIINQLATMSREDGVTIISATHDHKMLSVSDRVVWVVGGRIDRIGRRDELNIEVGTIE